MDTVRVSCYFHYSEALFLLDRVFKDHVLCARHDARIQGFSNEREKALSLESLPFMGKTVDQ